MTINELYRGLEPYIEDGVGNIEVYFDTDTANLKEVLSMNVLDTYIPYKKGPKLIIALKCRN